MPIKFFCNECGREIWEWEFLGDDKKDEITTLRILNNQLECSDCILARLVAADDAAAKAEQEHEKSLGK